MTGIKKALALAASALLLISACACGKTNNTVITDDQPYNGLFDTTRVHEIDVEISEDDWADLLKNPLQKTKYRANVTIDGNRVENVSFATKGNTSLSQVADSDSDRYSFKINFGKYVKKQTYFGLDKLNLNNIMSDATYMKDYLSYTIMREAGVDAPLISYVSLKINGKLHGLYIAIENISESFLERCTGSADRALYKPESERLANINGGMDRPDAPQNGGQGQMTPPDGITPPDGMTPPDGTFSPDGNDPKGGERPQFDMDLDSDGADLVYKDDDPASYSAVFDNEETDVDDEDRAKLISAIKSLTDGENADDGWDTQELARYFAAHNFLLNYDSYTGNMLHNYYIADYDGGFVVLPWDYNLAFCGFMGGGSADDSINTGIDSPLSSANEDQRPLWKAIASDERRLAAYHDAMDELIKGFFESGDCDAEIERVSLMIRSYVKDDPSAFYTVEQFDEAVSTLREFCRLRAQSIRLQLDGKLSAVTSEQNAEDRVDASSINTELMGTQGGRGDGQDRPGAHGGPGFPGGQQPPQGGGRDAQPTSEP